LNRDGILDLVVANSLSGSASVSKDQRLPAILQASRKYQNEVSIQLAGQVLRALNELCRGFNDANRAGSEINAFEGCLG